MMGWDAPQMQRSVLVGDADSVSRQRYRQSFELDGWTVDEADDGREALAKALAYTPSLVVVDAQLPSIDGPTLCELLRADHAARSTAILVVVSGAIPALVRRAHAAGADDVLTAESAADRLVESAHAVVGRATSSVGASRAQPKHRLSARTTMTSAAALPRRRSSQRKAHDRFDTIHPPLPAPPLVCPSCDWLLHYDHSHIGGVSARHSEQWDYYVCPVCGTFQYRQRTRSLRRIG